MWPRRETIRETEREKSADRRSWRKREACLEGPHGEVEAGYRPRERGPGSQAFTGVLVSSSGLVNSNGKEQGSRPMGLTHAGKAVGGRAFRDVISGTYICRDSVDCYLGHVLA